MAESSTQSTLVPSWSGLAFMMPSFAPSSCCSATATPGRAACLSTTMIGRATRPAEAGSERSVALGAHLRSCFLTRASSRYSAPDLLDRPQDIDHIEFDHQLADLRAGEEWARGFYAAYRSPLFDAEGGPLSVKFMTQERKGRWRRVRVGCR